MNRIFVSGDCHGNERGEMSRFNSKKFPEGKNLDKNDVMLITGDFGFIFHNNTTAEEKYWLDWMHNKPWTWATICGNHENHPKLNLLNQVDKFGDTVGFIRDSIFYLRRGIIYSIANKTFFCLGGALSTDKQRRKEYIDWWSEEELNYIETKRAYKNLDKVNWEVDYVITHDAPSWIVNFLGIKYEEESYTVKVLDDIFKNIHYKHHYFGHYHMDKTIMNKHTVCYNEIKEIV